jgi:hypothetical protein
MDRSMDLKLDLEIRAWVWMGAFEMRQKFDLISVINLRYQPGVLEVKRPLFAGEAHMNKSKRYGR